MKCSSQPLVAGATITLMMTVYSVEGVQDPSAINAKKDIYAETSDSTNQCSSFCTPWLPTLQKKTITIGRNHSFRFPNMLNKTLAIESKVKIMCTLFILNNCLMNISLNKKELVEVVRWFCRGFDMDGQLSGVQRCWG